MSNLLLETVRNFIAQSNLGEAIELLINIDIKDQDLINTAFLIKGRLVDLEDQNTRQAITQEEYRQIKNSVAKSILDIATQIEISQSANDINFESKYLNFSDDLIIDEIQKLIMDGNILGGINLLDFLTNKKGGLYSDYAKAAALVSSQYNSILKSQITGTITNNEVDFRISKLLRDFVGLLSEMSEAQKKKIEAKIESERIEKSAASYVEESINQLEKRERNLKFQALIWHILGFLSLISGISIGLYFLNSNSFDNNSNGVLVYQVVKSLFIIGLLVACARYTFLLGKSYMNESLKNADRIHAISFGKFYLQVFGTNIKPEDLKEIFKDWNASKDSAFASLNSADFDPKYLEVLTKFVETLKK